MAPLTDFRNTPKKESEIFLSMPVKGTTKVFRGSLVVGNAGYMAPGSTATGLLALGRAKSTYDNSAGADGAITGEYEPGIYRWANGDGIAQADVGKVAYVVDDQTVSKAGTGKSIAGTIVEVDTLGVWVKTVPTDGDESLRTDLAAVTGAGLVGSNAAGYAATTVSAQLAEVKAIADAGMPVLKKSIAVVFGDLTANVNGNPSTLNLDTALPANARIIGRELKLDTPFTGGGTVSLALDIGTAGDPNAIVAAADVLSAAVDGQASTNPDGIAPNRHYSAGGQLIATFTPDGAHKCTDLTAGAMTIDVLYTVLA